MPLALVDVIDKVTDVEYYLSTCSGESSLKYSFPVPGCLRTNTRGSLSCCTWEGEKMSIMNAFYAVHVDTCTRVYHALISRKVRIKHFYNRKLKTQGTVYPAVVFRANILLQRFTQIHCIASPWF